MGSPAGERSSKVDEIQHRVSLTHAFELAITEVTQGLWQTVTGENPSYFANCDSCPVDRVSWLDAVGFCNAFSEREGLDPAYLINGENVHWIRSNNGFRLPTEAEWEYACRAGSLTAYSTGPCLSADQGNYNGYHPLGHCPSGMNRGEPIEVGRFPANDWGLRDMHGNIAEWCWDQYGDYMNERVNDPSGPLHSDLSQRRVFRGGCFINFAPKCRSAARQALDPHKRVDMLGLRLARSKGKK
ncbi:MAG: formylglycine-generating enzyme family protein [Gemmatimonadales bacterium]|nr:formylglycine-generating enzyme family protein [Gemmatimonadales bacterium]